MLKTTQRQNRALLKAAMKNGGSISAEEYRNIISSKTSKSGRAKNTEFFFTVEVVKLVSNGYKVKMKGRHLSENTVNSLSLREKMKYKSSIKRAFKDAALLYRNQIPKRDQLGKLHIEPIAYNPRSRDVGNNSATIKIMVDAMVENLGFVKNDSREYVVIEQCGEVISKEWKMIFYMKHIL